MTFWDKIKKIFHTCDHEFVTTGTIRENFTEMNSKISCEETKVLTCMKCGRIRFVGCGWKDLVSEQQGGQK